MLQLALGLCLVLCASIASAQPPTPIEPSIRLECHGKLRTGVMAIGGETTGTTIEFDGMKWELKLPDEASRTFAKDHDKKPITVVGSLRQVAGKAVPVRYVVDVDVNGLKSPAAAANKVGATLTVSGTLRDKNAAAGEPPGIAIEADGITWPLDLSADRAVKAKAESLVGKSVVLLGQLERGAEAKCPPRPIIRVNKLDASTGKAIPK